MTKSTHFVTSNLKNENSAGNSLFYSTIKNLIIVIIPGTLSIGSSIYYFIEHIQNKLLIFISENTIHITCMVFFNPFEFVMQRHNFTHNN